MTLKSYCYRSCNLQWPQAVKAVVGSMLLTNQRLQIAATMQWYFIACQASRSLQEQPLGCKGNPRGKDDS